MIYKTTVKAIDGQDDLYIELPIDLFTDMGWDENTTLIWVVNEDGDVRIRARSYDTEPGELVEFISVDPVEEKNDLSNETTQQRQIDDN
jgi:hypothetical protein